MSRGDYRSGPTIVLIRQIQQMGTRMSLYVRYENDNDTVRAQGEKKVKKSYMIYCLNLKKQILWEKERENKRKKLHSVCYVKVPFSHVKNFQVITKFRM
jgi:hypothetical protein